MAPQCVLTLLQCEFVSGLRAVVPNLTSWVETSSYKRQRSISPRVSDHGLNSVFFNRLYAAFITYETMNKKRPEIHENGLDNLFCVAAVYYCRIAKHPEFKPKDAILYFTTCVYLALKWLDDESDIHPIDLEFILKVDMRHLVYYERKVISMLDWRLSVPMEDYMSMLLRVYNQGV